MRTGFSTPVDLRPIQGDEHHRFQTTKSASFYYGPGRRPGDYVLIPRGAVTNFGSFGIFRLFFRTYSSEYGLATLLHDAMTGEFGQPKACIYNHGDPDYMEVPNWETAAKWFYRAMKAGGTPWWQRKLFYHTVLLYKQIFNRRR